MWVGVEGGGVWGWVGVGVEGGGLCVCVCVCVCALVFVRDANVLMWMCDGAVTGPASLAPLAECTSPNPMKSVSEDSPPEEHGHAWEAVVFLLNVHHR